MSDASDHASTDHASTMVPMGLRVSVTRIGTQVVVRLSGDLDDSCAELLRGVVEEIATLALRRVVVDLDDVGRVQGAGEEFLATLHRHWTVRLLNPPACLRGRSPRRARLNPLD